MTFIWVLAEALQAAACKHIHGAGSHLCLMKQCADMCGQMKQCADMRGQRVQLALLLPALSKPARSCQVMELPHWHSRTALVQHAAGGTLTLGLWNRKVQQRSHLLCFSPVRL